VHPHSRSSGSFLLSEQRRDRVKDTGNSFRRKETRVLLKGKLASSADGFANLYKN